MGDPVASLRQRGPGPGSPTERRGGALISFYSKRGSVWEHHVVVVVVTLRRMHGEVRVLKMLFHSKLENLCEGK